ncbi:MAG: AAA family ATPase [Streptosporangiales bacterium]|nr:AAA family ATPase [Streptosporangiales bacterium]
MLVPLGVPEELAVAAARRLGAGAAERLREDPWLLLALPEIKPEQADYVARRLLGDRARPGDPRRGRALVGHLLARAARDGHTAVPTRRIGSALSGLGLADPTAALEAALNDGLVNAYDSAPGDDGEPESLLATAALGDAEDALAAGLARLVGTAELPGDPEAANAALDGLDGPVREVVLAVLAKAVAIAGHDSEDGLAAVVSALAAILDEQGLEIVLTAPTAPAARRLGALTGLPAVPLHELLEPQGAGGPYARGEDWPVEADLIVVGAAELLDVRSAVALVAACADGARLLLAGDPAALPSAGPGRVFADAAICLPYAHLPDAAGAPAAASRPEPLRRLVAGVRDGALPSAEDPERSVVVVQVRDAAEAAHRTVQLVTDSIPRALGIPAGEVQVVTPVHRGAAGTAALNEALKARLNPGPGAYGGFDPGDRVVVTTDRSRYGLPSGDLGEVVRAGTDGLTVRFPGADGSPVDLSLPVAGLDELRHGWATTVHRAHGGRWPAAVAVLPGDVAGALSRPLVYTAFNHGERHLSVVHGAGATLAQAVRSVPAPPRRTRLTELLQAEFPEPTQDDE